MGLQVKTYTREQLQSALCEDLYTRDAQDDGALQKRVRQYKELLDQLGLLYDATQDEIMATIQTL